MTVQEAIPGDHINILTANTGAPANFSIYVPGLAPTTVTGASSWSFSGFNMVHVTVPNGAASVIVVFAVYTPPSIIDQAFAYYGIVTANILAVLSAFVVYSAASATAIISLITSIMTLVLFVSGSLIYWLALFVNFFVSLFTIIGNIINGTTAYTTGLGNIWNLIGFATWASAVPVFAFIFWVNSVSDRTRKTGRSNIEIIIGDLQIVTYLVGEVWSWVYTVFNFVVNIIMTFLSVIIP